MRRGCHVRGFTMIELLTASTIATVVGGAMILLMTGVRDVSQTHTTFNQLSGYLEATATVLAKDIWSAVNVCQGIGCPRTVDPGTTWLALDAPPSNAEDANGWVLNGTSGPDVRYTIQGTNLVREVWNGAAWGAATWNIAQFVVPAATIAQINPLVDHDSNPVTPPVSQPGLIRVQLQVSRTVNGRAHIRTDTFDCRYQIP